MMRFSNSVNSVKISDSDFSRSLCEKPAFVARASSGPARFTMQKSWQGARVYFLLVEVLGPSVSNVVPELSVSCSNLLELNDLQKLVSDVSNEQVRTIMRKPQPAEALQTD